MTALRAAGLWKNEILSYISLLSLDTLVYESPGRVWINSQRIHQKDSFRAATFSRHTVQQVLSRVTWNYSWNLASCPAECVRRHFRHMLVSIQFPLAHQTFEMSRLRCVARPLEYLATKSMRQFSRFHVCPTLLAGSFRNWASAINRQPWFQKRDAQSIVENLRKYVLRNFHFFMEVIIRHDSVNF